MSLESILLLYLLDLDLRLPLNSVVALVFVKSILFFCFETQIDGTPEYKEIYPLDHDRGGRIPCIHVPEDCWL